MAEWIWYPGDFELYHSTLVHTRRQEKGFDYPGMWYIPRPELNCVFEKEVEFEKDTAVTVYTHGKGFVRANDANLGGVNRPLVFPAGKYGVVVEICDTEKFPAMFIPDGPLATDSSWLVHRRVFDRRTPGGIPDFNKAEDDPSVFPFEYKKLVPVSVTQENGGTLYDFGVESFGPVTLCGKKEFGGVVLSYGESKEEALDTAFSIVHETLEAFEGSLVRPARAFRYIFVKGQNGCPSVSAELEYLPVEDKAYFVCDNEKIAKIWEIASRTFHLNSREFYLDGIKRDRWVWSGDAYQSFMINRCLYFDEAIVRRTIRALLGKAPYHQHINRINDYSMYLIISVYDHYFATGDAAFVNEIKTEVKALYDFITGRLNKDGYMVGLPGDWVFIDWSDIDKTCPVCAEQIILWKMYRVIEELSSVWGEKGDYAEKAEKLKENIFRDYWDESRGAFIDSFVSGKNNITRHANIFALLYGFTDEDKSERITKGVLLGDLAKQITTPYFKYYELTALAMRGEIMLVEDFIEEYWGGMTDLGATSVWEQYDPTVSGAEHYAMYGEKYGKSLCHAWGCGPISLLTMFVAGVRPTGLAFSTFEVAPCPGKYSRFSCAVPVKDGIVTVKYENGTVTAKSTRPGGVLKFAGKEIPMPADTEVSVTE